MNSLVEQIRAPSRVKGFQKGKPKTGGRKAGVPNKSTVSVKTALEEAFNNLGGVEAMVDWAREEPTEFYKLYAKLLPVQVQAKLNSDSTMRIIVETGVPRAPNAA